MLALVRGPHLRPELLVGEILPLEEAGTALAAMDRPATAGRDDCDQASRVTSNSVCSVEAARRSVADVVCLANKVGFD